MASSSSSWPPAAADRVRSGDVRCVGRGAIDYKFRRPCTLAHYVAQRGQLLMGRSCPAMVRLRIR